MRFASFRDIRLKASQILEQGRAMESVIITKRGKPVALLIPTAEESIDEFLRAVEGVQLRAAVNKARREAVLAGSNHLNMKEINLEIRKVRSKRRG